MQTFLPYPNFIESAKCLDYKRLGKQRSECIIILQCLLGKNSGWKNHPAVKMWRGYELSLFQYGIAICEQWISKGFKDSCKQKLIDLCKGKMLSSKFPYWLGNIEFHSSHKSNLLRKDFNFYSKFGWIEPINLPYFWPKEN